MLLVLHQNQKTRKRGPLPYLTKWLLPLEPGFRVTAKRNLIFKKIDFSLTVKMATLIFISGRGSAISSAKEGKSGFIYNLIKSL